jgi:N-acetylmuramoyl-L-alanine amidase
MERTPMPGYAAEDCLLSYSRGVAQLALLCLVLALLVLTAGGGAQSPPGVAHATGTQAPVTDLEVQRGEEFWLLSSRVQALAPTSRLTPAAPLSTGAGGACHTADVSVVVQPGDTLGGIAARYGTFWPLLASYNHLPNPNLIFPGQMLCIATTRSPSAQRTSVTDTPLLSNTPAVGRANLFPQGQCTWWANQRYYQLHGVYVPWTTRSDAWQWTARAHDFGWRVATSPQVGDIIDLQPWVQGAYGLGHVAVVEGILGNGDVVASNMNWGATPWMVVDVEFTPGAGVTFIRL